MTASLSSAPHLEDLLYGVRAGLCREFPGIAPDRVASTVDAARVPELGLLPDLPAYASAVARRARLALASGELRPAGGVENV